MGNALTKIIYSDLLYGTPPEDSLSMEYPSASVAWFTQPPTSPTLEESLSTTANNSNGTKVGIAISTVPIVAAAVVVVVVVVVLELIQVNCIGTDTYYHHYHHHCCNFHVWYR
jgi:hypothetical protein